MEVGMISRWGSPKPGRERDALENYRHAVAYGRRLVEEGKLTYFEPFFLNSGDAEIENGFFIARGPVAQVFEILESEEYRDLTARAQLLSEHMHTDMLTVGEGIDRTLADYEKALTSLGV